MLHLRQDDLLIPNAGRTLLVRGGWDALVPEVKAEAQVHNAYCEYYMAAGMEKIKAIKEAEAAVQDLFTSRFVQGLRQCISYWAKQYAKHWPEAMFHVRERIYLLKGFDPEQVQTWYVPGQRTGRSGLPFPAKQLLAEMAR